MNAMEYREKLICENATGIIQCGNLEFWYQGDKASITAARKLFREGEIVEVPGAGAGSYREVLGLLGYQRVQVHDWTSSAGDWTFVIRGRHGKQYVSQENRYPYYGFRYGLCRIFTMG